MPEQLDNKTQRGKVRKETTLSFLLCFNLYRLEILNQYFPLRALRPLRLNELYNNLLIGACLPDL